MSAGGRVLLMLCRPWVVAIPIPLVVRVLGEADLELVVHSGSGALLGTVADGDVRYAAWDLGGLLGVPGAIGQAWVLLDLPVPLALRGGPCLSVVPEPPTCALPSMLSAHAFGLGCFVRPALPLPQHDQAGLAPVGLRIDPQRLLGSTAWADSQRVIGASRPRATPMVFQDPAHG